MYLFDVYFKNKLKEKSSSRNSIPTKYNKVFLGVNLFNLNYIRKSLSEGNRCLIIFEKDIIENTQPNLLLGSSFIYNLFFFYLRNLSINQNEDPIEKNRIQENYKNLINICNLNFRLFSQKYHNNLQNFTLFIQNDFGSILKRIFFQLVINYELYKNNFDGNYLKFHKNFLFSKCEFIQVNQIIQKEIFEMKNLFEDNLDIKSYTNINEIIKLKSSNYELEIFDKFKRKNEKLLCDELIVFNKNYFKHNLKISNEQEYNQDFYLNSRCFLNLNIERDRENLNLFELKYEGKGNREIKESFYFNLNSKYIEIFKNEETIIKKSHPDEKNEVLFRESGSSIKNFLNSSKYKEILYFIKNFLGWKYFKMKTRKFNNIIEEEIMRSSLALNKNNLNNQKMNDETIMKLTNSCSDEFFLFTSNGSREQEIEEYLRFLKQLDEKSNKNEKRSLQIVVDELKMYFKEMDTEKIKTLLENYDIKSTKEIIDRSFKNKENIIKAQIKYEIHHRYLKTPIDFLTKRHDNIKLLSNHSVNLFIFISPFAEEFHHSYKNINDEIFKLMSLKYLNYH